MIDAVTKGQEYSVRNRRITQMARQFIWWLLGVALVLVFFNTAVTPITVALDSSSQGLFEYYADHGYQFGKEAIHVVGPYGYVIYHSGYAGSLFSKRLVLNLLLKGLYAWLIITLVRRRKQPLTGTLLVIALVLVGSRLQDDFLVNMSLLISGVLLAERIDEGSARWPLLVLLGGFLGFSALLKGTNLFASAVVVLIVVSLCVARREWWPLGWLASAYVGAMLTAWLFAGQRLTSLVSYWMATVAFAAGYNEANALIEGSASVFWYGALTALCLILLLTLYAFVTWNGLLTLAVAAMFGLFSFMRWKHGFVRADGHVQDFFHYALIAAFLIPVVFGSRIQSLSWINRFSKSCRTVLILLASTTITLAVLGSRTEPTGPLDTRTLHQEVWSRVRRNWNTLVEPVRARETLDAALEHNRATYQLPAIKRVVGNATVDFFGTNMGVMILNGLNYRPRPVAPTFEAHGEYLMTANLEAVSDPKRRPEFFLLAFEPIDYRLYSQDDALTLNYLLQNYEPVLTEKQYCLLKIRSQVKSADPIAIATVIARPGQEVLVPPSDDSEVLLASVKANLNLWGSARSLLIRPPLAYLEMTLMNGSMQRHHILLSSAQAPFIIDPVLDNMFALYRYFYLARSGTALRSIRVTTAPPEQLRLLQPEITIQFSKLPRARREAGQPLFSGFSRAPIDIQAFAIQSVRDAEGREALLVHAPGEVVFPAESTPERLTGKIGILPQAYQLTDGVEFLVVLEREGRPRETLWRRLLRPSAAPSDRGTQEFSVGIPHGSKGLIRILTTVGPSGNSAGDQSYFTELRFH